MTNRDTGKKDGMSGNADKTAWPTRRWLLHGTTFAFFQPLFVLSGITLFTWGSAGLFFGHVVGPLMVVVGGGLFFAAWRWRRYFFRKSAAGCFPRLFILRALPFFLPLWYVLVAGAMCFFFMTDPNVLLFALYPYFFALMVLAFLQSHLIFFWGALIIAGLTALAGMIAAAWAIHDTTERAWGTVALLAITVMLAVICVAGFGQYRPPAVLGFEKNTQDVLSPKGQELLENNGYVPLQGGP